MIIAFVLILSIVWISLATALYSNFLPYLALLRDVKNYNMAYYGANTAIERSLLVLRYQEAGFQWTWWWNKKNSIADTPVSDQILFWNYWNNTTLQWSIIGRPDSNSIPWTGQWNIDSYLLSGASNDRNMLTYRNPQKIPLWIDNTPSVNAYSGDEEREYFAGSDIVLNLQLIPSVQSLFSSLSPTWRRLQNTDDWDWDWVWDDIVVDRWRKGLYDSGNYQFSILPRSLVWILSGQDEVSVQDDDESIRESILNTLATVANIIPISFGDYINPLYDINTSDSLRIQQRDSHLMISDDSTDANLISGMDFNDLLNPVNQITDQELNLFLTKHLLSESNGVYPFLQYNINFAWDPNTIAQPYFLINGKSQVWEYTVQMNLKKSVNKNETLGSFTVVF